MSRAIARVGDLTDGICRQHSSPRRVTGRIITGSPTVMINNRPVARLGDKVLTDCGHQSLIITASAGSESDGHGGIARVGDQIGDGPYTAIIITGSPDSFSN